MTVNRLALHDTNQKQMKHRDREIKLSRKSNKLEEPLTRSPRGLHCARCGHVLLRPEVVRLETAHAHTQAPALTWAPREDAHHVVRGDVEVVRARGRAVHRHLEEGNMLR